MIKWIGIAFVVAVVYMIVTGNMGGAQKATKNYSEIMRGGAGTNK